MAYDKIIPVRSRLDRCVSYVRNPEKTGLAAALHYIGNTEKNTVGQTVLETAIHCTLENAYQDMMATKQRWGKTGGVQGYHLIHAYAPGEVTPSEAHALGVEFAQRLLGDRYEAVVATHTDCQHLHCHILFNAVSFIDGSKFRNSFRDYYRDIRGVSNAVSQSHGLSVITPEGTGRQYAEWQAAQAGKPTIRGLIRADLDAAIAHAFTYRSFWAHLEKQGYAIKRGPHIKHTAIRPPGGRQFIRLRSLGEGYTELDIQRRLAEIRSGKADYSPAAYSAALHRYTICRGGIQRQARKKLQGWRALYVRYLYLLGLRRPRPEWPPVPFHVRKEATKLGRYAAQFRFLQKYRIDTAAQLTMLQDALQAEIDALTEQRKGLYRIRRQGLDVNGEIQAITQKLRPLRKDFVTCTRIAQTVPYIREQTGLCRDTWRKEKNHRTQNFEKANQARPYFVSLPGR